MKFQVLASFSGGELQERNTERAVSIQVLHRHSSLGCKFSESQTVAGSLARRYGMLLITIRRLHSRRCRVGRIRDALVAAPCVTQDDLVQKDALDLCLKQHALGLTHLMVPSSICAPSSPTLRIASVRPLSQQTWQVLSLWGARMVAEACDRTWLRECCFSFWHRALGSQEVSELLNSGTILSLIADPDPTQNGFLEELSRALWADLETEGLDWGA